MAKVVLIDKDGFKKKTTAMRAVDFGQICKNNLAMIYNRTRSMTPVDSGELRLSASADLKGGFDGEVGYIKDYAPHVEFGHRTRDGGYVKGQRFLQKNVNTQIPIFERQLREAVENAK